MTADELRGLAHDLRMLPADAAVSDAARAATDFHTSTWVARRRLNDARAYLARDADVSSTLADDLRRWAADARTRRAALHETYGAFFA
jgi:hypothetical protein